MNDLLHIDGLEFCIRRSNQRTTLGITVERDGSLVVRSPMELEDDKLIDYIRSKVLWVHTKLTEKRMLQDSKREREFVNGEGFYYLGRNHRLLIVPAVAGTPPIRLYAGRFQLRQDEVIHATKNFVEWYTQHGQVWLWNRTNNMARATGMEFQGIEIMDLGHRWGSYSQNGFINFHWRVILLPPRIIDYIILHELQHIREPHHNQRFWKYMRQVMPDYEQRKYWLALNGAAYDL